MFLIGGQTAGPIGINLGTRFNLIHGVFWSSQGQSQGQIAVGMRMKARFTPSGGWVLQLVCMIIVFSTVLSTF